MEELREQQKMCQRKCTEVLFFITKDFRLEHISVQGRVLLIYCYLMTIVSRLLFLFFCFFKLFVIGKKEDHAFVIQLRLCVFFMMFL